MKPLALLLILLAALWLWQYRPIPVDRSWWFEVPAAEWRGEHGNITVICEPWSCWFERNGKVVKL